MARRRRRKARFRGAAPARPDRPAPKGARRAGPPAPGRAPQSEDATPGRQPAGPQGPAGLASAAGQKVKEAVATVFELPRDVILDLPRLTLIGNLQLTVENHRGLVEYTPERIRIAIHDGRLEIAGQGLRIGSVYREELIVTGRIEAVRYGG